MSKVYVPDDSFVCYQGLNSDTIRAYKENPVVGNSVSYIDYFTMNHYNNVEGVEIITEQPLCIANFTNDFYYRNDIVDILLLFVIFSFFALFIPIKTMSRLFRRFQ